jgi:autotransporter-associated beta strand protein
MHHVRRFALLGAMGLALPASAAGQTVWSGFDLSFAKPNSADWTIPENQDRITDNVWLTRANTQGLFNIAAESFYSSGSPTGTRWATQLTSPGETISAANWENLTFMAWAGAYGGAGSLATNITAFPAVVHLVTDDIYLDLQFTSWAAVSGGGFAYNRATGAAGPRSLVWNPAGAGGTNWSTDTANTNWLDGAVASSYADGDVVNFTDSGVGAVIIDGGGVAPGGTNISNTSGTYSFTGGALGGAGALTKTGGGSVLMENVNTYTGGTSVSDGTLTFAARIPTGAVSMSGGTLRVAAKAVPNDPAGTSVITSLSITGSTLDLTNNHLIVQGGDLDQINTLVVSGRDGGTWTGEGINSSIAAVEAGRALGIRQDGSDVEVAFTWAGDATLDGAVTIADLGILAANWQQGNRYWFHGDFNYDGEVNIADLGILAANWQKGTGGGAAMSFDEAMAMFDVFDGVVVPEPAAIGLAPMIGLLAMRKRR